MDTARRKRRGPPAHNPRPVPGTAKRLPGGGASHLTEYVFETSRACSGCGSSVTLRFSDASEVKRIVEATGVSESYARQVVTLRSSRNSHRLIGGLAGIEVTCPSCQRKESRGSRPRPKDALDTRAAV